MNLKAKKPLNNRLLLSLMFLLTGCVMVPTPHSTVDVIPTWTPQATKNIFIPTITPKPGTPNLAVYRGKIPLPPEGYLFHGVYPGGSQKEDVTYQALLEYESAVGKQTTWVYFSTYWFQSREFPKEISTWIRNAGSIPYIRLMLQSGFQFDGNETFFTLQNIISGQFDIDLRTWCSDARDFGTALLVEYGTEVNSDSFPWSGVENGAGAQGEYGDPNFPDGPERFQDAYRHIIQICRDAGAENITWVFHLDSISYPNATWNRFENYYPGDEWVDWIGISIYGTHTPMDIYSGIFREDMEGVHDRIIKLTSTKPIIVAEFGTAKNNPLVDQVQWTRNAFVDITSGRYQNLIGFAWWNEAWINDGNPAHNTTMRVQDNPELAELFKKNVGNNPAIIGEISQ